MNREGYLYLIEIGFTYSRLKESLDAPDNWAELVNAVVFLTVLDTIIRYWPEDLK